LSEAPEIRREDAPGRRRYALAGPGGEAELTLSAGGPGTWVAEHTYVPPEARGQGLGEALVARLMADARAEAFRVVPRCPFVAAQLRYHPEWADLAAR
jgi:predicted GNAT family acetyltransferase